MSKERWRFVTDDDHHWYLIPMSEQAQFDALVDDDPAAFEEAFLDRRCGDPWRYSFTDPEVR